MRIIKILFLCHLAALLFGLGGLLIALPHPELWSGSAAAAQVFAFGIRYAGSLHIVFGAATMLLFGLLCVGWRKTLIFFVAATTISLSMELLGTGTGFPFGAYSYTDFLGVKVAGRVPYSIPLSWFYMGFASLLLASVLTGGAKRHQMLWTLALGAYFLTVWDLVLDPAMASPHLPVHFWTWHLTGPYFGMPIRNLVGWTLTGLLFMGVSQLAWRAPVDTSRLRVWLPYGVYAANTIFAMALSVGAAGLWLPPLFGVVFGLLPATFALRASQRGRFVPGGGIAERLAQLTLRIGGRVILDGAADVTVRGVEHLPASGPVVIAARHVHHLYDGCVLVESLARPVHIMVALDWVRTSTQRRVMEWACAMARWPVILRSERLRAVARTGLSAYNSGEAPRYLRHAVVDAVALLGSGEALVVFPEAYPYFDPTFTPKQHEDDFLPFREGFVRIARLAERDGHTCVPIVPAGLSYTRNPKGRWQITLRLGAAVAASACTDTIALTRMIEERVRALSLPESSTAPEPSGEVSSVAPEGVHP